MANARVGSTRGITTAMIAGVRLVQGRRSGKERTVLVLVDGTEFWLALSHSVAVQWLRNAGVDV